MDDVRIARTTRTGRGMALAAKRGDDIERTTAHTYKVPSCTGPEVYTVMIDVGYCSCPDHSRAKELGAKCKHVIAAEIVAAKRRAARGCYELDEEWHGNAENGGPRETGSNGESAFPCGFQSSS